MASSCNDTVERTTLWSGKVGLIYPSDYGYATSGGQTISKETCQNIGFGTWLDSDKKDCSENDWLFSSKAVWTITPHVMNDTANNGFNVNPVGSVSRNNVYNSFEILPSIYLKESIRIIDGQGTKSNPYILS